MQEFFFSFLIVVVILTILEAAGYSLSNGFTPELLASGGEDTELSLAEREDTGLSLAGGENAGLSLANEAQYLLLGSASIDSLRSLIRQRSDQLNDPDSNIGTIH